MSVQTVKATINGQEYNLTFNLEQYITNEVVRVQSIEESKPANNNAIKIEKIKTEMERLNMMFRKERISEEEYDTDYLKLEKKLKTPDTQEEPEKRDLDALKGILEADYRTLYNHLTKENKKAFWRRIIKEFAIDENKKSSLRALYFFN